MRKLVILGVLLISGCGTTDTLTSNSVHLKTAKPKTSCSARDSGKLPDPSCTPGVIDPRVTQANIHQTICVHGYTATVRPSVSYTNSLKRQQIQLYGYTDTNLHDYEEDHLISLELGGAPKDPKNLWPEAHPSPNPKDSTENLLHKRVCLGQITLAEAQHEISTNWTAVK